MSTTQGVSALELWQSRTRQQSEEVEDELLPEAQAARLAGMKLETLRKLPSSDRPMTYWRSDVTRWAAGRKRGGR